MDLPDYEHVAASIAQGVNPGNGKPFASEGWRLEALAELSRLRTSIESAAKAIDDAEISATVASAIALGEAAAQSSDTVAPRGSEVRDVAPVIDNGERPVLSENLLLSVGEATHDRRTLAERFDQNVASIRLASALRENGSQPTPDEARRLVAFSGWGGLLKLLNERQADLVDQGVMTDGEWEEAAASALTAFYTPASVVGSMWDLLQRAGFKGGNVLDPAAGTGAFLNVRPGVLDVATHYTAVELDLLTGSILELTNPTARVFKMGLERTRLADDSFDLVIGNVPFGEIPVSDAEVPGNLSIHNYFLAKSLRKARVGGVVAIITSPWTLDAKSPHFRQQIADHADLIGAIRIPSGQFANAHTDVISDLLIFRKRVPGTEYRGLPFLSLTQIEIPASRDLEWKDRNSGEVHSYDEGDSVPVSINEVFTTAGAFFGGDISANTKQWKDRCVVDVIGDEASFQSAIEQLGASIGTDLFDGSRSLAAAKADDSNPVIETAIAPIYGALVRHEGKIFQAVAADLVAGRFQVELAPTSIADRDLARVDLLIEMRDLAQRLLMAEREDQSIAQLDALRADLSAQYDGYVAQYGYLNETRNRRLLMMDAAGPMLLGLEFYDEDKKTARKSEIFHQRVISKPVPIESASSFAEAVAISMAQYGRVVERYVGELLDGDFNELVSGVEGVLFRDPGSREWIIESVYLSGNVRVKLANAQQAAGEYPEFERNVKALEAIIPADILAEDIKADLASSWIPTTDIEDFIVAMCRDRGLEVSVTASRLRTGESNCEVTPSRYAQNSALVLAEQLGTPHRSFGELIAAAMSNRAIRITETVDGQTVFLREATLDADAKLQEVKELFKNWVWQDPDRTTRLAKRYNERFNAYVFQEFDGSHLTFPGLSPLFKPMEHQSGLVARGLALGNTLAAHAVGAGKTFEMVSLSMEKRRLGHCRRPMISVPNHMLYQMATEAMSFYPGARIALITKEDLRKENRRAFLARIAYNDWDLIIITHSTLARIGVPVRFEVDLIDDALAKLRADLNRIKASDSGSRWSERRIQVAIKKKRDQLADLQRTLLKDSDGISLDLLGIDQLSIDEAHLFKNLELDTPISLPGVSDSASNRAWSLFLKTRYLYELHGEERGVDFFTATPIANTIAELYTMGRYLRPSIWADMGIEHFGDWVGVFGEVTSELEVLPEGGGFQLKSRLNNFANVPELLTAYRLFADVKTREDLNLPVPKYTEHVVTAEPSPWQRLYLEDLTRRAKAVRSGEVDRHEDNLLAIVGDGRRSAMDMRLIEPLLPEEPDTKLAMFLDNAMRVYERTTELRGAQIVFCDVSTPGGKKPYDVYNDCKRRLIKSGIPESEIAFIHDVDKDEHKLALYRKVNSGAVRFLFGSTEKLGVGTNAQERLAALHNLDAPWRPNDLEQRLGRIVRRGNIFGEVDIFNYTTKDSFDLFMWETNKRKARFINQIMRDPRSAGRTLTEDAEINYAAVVAVTTGSPVIREKVEIDAAVAKLQRQAQMFHAQQSRQRSAIAEAKRDVVRYEKAIERLTADTKAVLRHLEPIRAAGHDLGITFLRGIPEHSDGPASFVDRKAAAKALWVSIGRALFGQPLESPVDIGEIYGVKVTALNYRSVWKKEPLMSLTLHLSEPQSIDLGEAPHILLKKVMEALAYDLPNDLRRAKNRLASAHEFLQHDRLVEGAFGRTEELEQLMARQREVNAELQALEEKQLEVMDTDAPTFQTLIEEYLAGTDAEMEDGEEGTEEMAHRLSQSLTQQSLFM